MRSEPIRNASFEITHESEPSTTLVAGFSTFGLAGLTAVDYLVNQFELDATGHISADDLPTITPFENGVPRHHTRLFSGDDLAVTLLLNELFVPVWAADSLADEVLSWMDGNNVEEITILAGVPVPHGPDDHRVFSVATEDYRAHRLEDVDIRPMGNGFLDGINASLISQGMDSPLRVGVLITPVHAQAPDAEAALRLVGAVRSVYDLDIDTGALESFSKEIEQYYRELAERLENMDQQQMPEDRMYM